MLLLLHFDNDKYYTSIKIFYFSFIIKQNTYYYKLILVHVTIFCAIGEFDTGEWRIPEIILLKLQDCTPHYYNFTPHYLYCDHSFLLFYLPVC